MGAKANASTVIYLEYAFKDLHFEITYSIIHRFCSCSNDDGGSQSGDFIDKTEERNSSTRSRSLWSVNRKAPPRFFLGPERHILSGTRRILREFNDTIAPICGPLFIGSPSELGETKEPDLTVVTTTYPIQLGGDSKDPKQAHLVNDERYLIICHEDARFLENATNVYFLTPLHRRYIVPEYFPPSFVDRSVPNDEKFVFLVIGDISRRRINKRHMASLAYALDRYWYESDIRIRIMGNFFNITTLNSILHGPRFGRHIHKIEVVRGPDSYDFLTNVSDAHAILPLVDGTNFVYPYQSGKKLTSSLMWAKGFRKKVLVYDKLAEVFGLEGDNETIWVYNNPWDGFAFQFGRCLRRLKQERAAATATSLLREPP